MPLDHAKPSGRQIKLTLSIAGDLNAPRTLVVNPGESGIGTAKLVWRSLPQAVGAQYNMETQEQARRTVARKIAEQCQADSKDLLPYIPQAVSGYRRGDASALLGATDQLALGSVDPAQLVYNCVDDAWPRDWATWHRDTTVAAPKAPLFAWLNTWYGAPCTFWKAPTARPVEIGSAMAPPVLLLQARDDPAPAVR